MLVARPRARNPLAMWLLLAAAYTKGTLFERNAGRTAGRS